MLRRTEALCLPVLTVQTRRLPLLQLQRDVQRRVAVKCADRPRCAGTSIRLCFKLPVHIHAQAVEDEIAFLAGDEGANRQRLHILQLDHRPGNRLPGRIDYHSVNSTLRRRLCLFAKLPQSDRGQKECEEQYRQFAEHWNSPILAGEAERPATAEPDR